ncbi:MAG: inorganic diphosphatase [Gammaproteobacteria bacterium]|nr:inorganic diphosphatase [Gammaproteobacteria bacterium]
MNIKEIAFSSPDRAQSVPVIIEIPAYADPIKYELDKESGVLAVDRFLQTPMQYPCHYGLIPNTLGGDGDPLDVLVYAPYKLIPGCLIRVRLLGGIVMHDESGEDLKFIAVPISKLSPEFEKFQEVHDLDEGLIKKIFHFFEHYKDLEKGKWVKMGEIFSAQKAREVLLSSIT